MPKGEKRVGKPPVNAWLPGVSQNPGGFRKGTSIVKFLREYLELSSKEREELSKDPKLTGAQEIALKLIGKGTSGEIMAIQELLERADGRVRETMDLNTNPQTKFSEMSNEDLLSTITILTKQSKNGG